MGPFKTPYTEIEAYSRVMRIEMEPWEASAIRGLGEAYLRHYKRKSETPGGMRRTISMSDSEGIKSLFANVGDKKPTKKGLPNGPGRTGHQGR